MNLIIRVVGITGGKGLKGMITMSVNLGSHIDLNLEQLKGSRNSNHRG